MIPSTRDFLASCPPAPTFDWARCRACSAPMRSDGTACTGVGRHPARPATTRLYATWTGTAANLAALHREGARLLTGPDQLDRRGLPPLAWAVDNGAWGCHQRGTAFDGDAFRRALERWGVGADWIAIPDIVAGGLASLDLSLSWLQEVAATGRPALIPVQDGMEADHVRPHLSSQVGIFVGGTTAWKLATVRAWGELAREVGCHLHMGRVNSEERIRIAIDAGCDSVDGTSLSRFSVNAPRLGEASRELRNAPLFGAP